MPADDCGLGPTPEVRSFASGDCSTEELCRVHARMHDLFLSS